MASALHSLLETKMISLSSKEVWKILPCYEELSRASIGRGKDRGTMSVGWVVN